MHDGFVYCQFFKRIDTWVELSSSMVVSMHASVRLQSLILHLRMYLEPRINNLEKVL